MHPNKIVREPIQKILGNNSKVCLTNPLNYEEFLFALQNCHCVVTDSGGIQEEAPFLGKPVLIFRDTTERVESIELGCAKLIGTSSEKLVEELGFLIKEKNIYKIMSRFKEAYGDGYSSSRILDACKKNLDESLKSYELNMSFDLAWNF